jgi:hypothetical protein
MKNYTLLCLFGLCLPGEFFSLVVIDNQSGCKFKTDWLGHKKTTKDRTKRADLIYDFAGSNKLT